MKLNAYSDPFNDMYTFDMEENHIKKFVRKKK